MKVAVDTNILAYAEGVNGETRRQAAWDVIARIRIGSPVVPAQVLGELFNVLERKAKFSRSKAHDAVLGWSQIFYVVDTTSEVFFNAVDLAKQHRFQIWDCVIVSAASRAGCRLLLSEDMHDGFVWNGLTVANPFSARPHPLVEAALKP